MNKQPWTSTNSPLPPRSFEWPTAGQWLRQILVLALIWGVWGGAFVTFLSLVSPTTDENAAAPAGVSSVTESPTATTTPVPPSPTPSATVTPLPSTPTPISATVAEADNMPPTATALPTDTATAIPTPAPPTATPSPEPTEVPANTGLVSFNSEVLPVLQNRCLQCHGPDRLENNFSVESHADIMAGSWNGTVVNPGDPEGSYLLDLIISGEMPQNAPRLLPGEINLIRTWIEEGALDN